MAKVTIGKIEEELVKKTKRYKELTGKGTVTLVEELLTDFFKDSLLTNDFLELEEPFYFLHNEYYYKDKIIKASLENPTGTVIEGVKIEPFEVYIVNKVPNNLDSFSEEYNKFCYNNNPDRHKGIYVFHNFEALSDNPEEALITCDIYLFDYNEVDKTLIIEDLSFSKEELSYRIDLATHKEVYDSIINEVENYNDWVFEKGLDPEDPERLCLNYIFVLTSFEVIEPYEDKVAMKNYLVKTGSYNPEDELKGIRKAVFKDRKLVKPTDLLKEVLRND